MRTILLAALLSIALSPAAAQAASIQVTINNPPNSPAGSPITIRATVASTFQLSQVVATIEGVDYPLSPCGSTCWAGSAAVTLTRGTHTIAVTATDVFSNQGSASTQFLFDQPPVLAVTAPGDQAVARPGLRVAASCVDDDTGCQIRVQVVGCCTPFVLARVPAPIDSVLSLSLFEGQQITLEITAIDSFGQQTSTRRTIYVDSSAHYQQRAVSNGKIVAFDDTHLLVTRTDETGFQMALQSRLDGTETLIFNAATAAATWAFLTPLGAMFAWRATDTSFDELFEWRNGTRVDRGRIDGGLSLRVSGSFAIWNTGISPSALMFEDILAGSIVTPALDVLNINNNVAATGYIAYAAKSSGVYRIFAYLNGATTPLPHDGDAATSDVYPITDGTSIVYGRITDAAHAAQVVSVTGGHETARGFLYTADATPGQDYQAAGGWIAYRIQTLPGLVQVFAGPASGQTSQISFFSTSSSLAALDDSGGGQVAFVNGTQTYLASASASAVAVGSVLGTTAFLNSVCYRVIGNTLFEVSTASVPFSSISASPASLGVAIQRAADGSVASVTPSQSVRVTQNGAGPLDWSPSSDVAWLRVMPGSHSGSGVLTVTVDPSAAGVPASGSATAHITITPSTPSPALVIPVTLNVYDSGTTAPPFGSFDTPMNGSTGLAGSIAVTGWALDNLQVARLMLCRDAAAGETAPVDPNCAGAAKIYIGDAVFVDGARPDIQAMFPFVPLNTRAGWGYLLLTNFLPNGGNGTFVLYAYASNVAGQSTLLGAKTITVDNAHSLAPFGAIDTPGQGEVVRGLVPNFGWVLSPAPRFADPPDGGIVTVFIDGAPVGSPGGWASRDDLSRRFDVSKYPGVDSALGVFGLDTTTLANGVHTIFWVVTDNLGTTSGVGSRYFTVSNGALTLANAAASAGSKDPAYNPRDAIADVGRVFRPGADAYVESVLLGRRGFDLNAPLDFYYPDPDGVVTIHAHELERVELQLGPGATGALITAQGEKPLPIGAHIDPATGVFTWAPGVGYVGRYDLVLGGHRVRIVLNPKD